MSIPKMWFSSPVNRGQPCLLCGCYQKPNDVSEILSDEDIFPGGLAHLAKIHEKFLREITAGTPFLAGVHINVIQC